jgi:hypothetical protein
MSGPANGATVSGSTVTVSATASDNVGVAGVQFKLTAEPRRRGHIVWSSEHDDPGNGSHMPPSTRRREQHGDRRA